MLTTPLTPLVWQSATAAPALEGPELHLWRIDIGPGGGDPHALWNNLSAEEQARADRLSVPARCDAYVRAHAGLRQVLSLYLDRAPREVRLMTGETGKPLLADAGLGLHFNLTTTAELALLGVSRWGPVGVDCERLDPRRDLAAVARRMFPPALAEAVVGAPEPLRLERFYRAWTALEAEVKCDGRGLGRRSLPAGATPVIRHCIPAEGFIAAVAREALPQVYAWRGLRLEGARRSRD